MVLSWTTHCFTLPMMTLAVKYFYACTILTSLVDYILVLNLSKIHEHICTEVGALEALTKVTPKYATLEIALYKARLRKGTTKKPCTHVHKN